MTIEPTTTVGQLVVERPSRARIFETLGIDYCCGGKITLSEACRTKRIDVGTVIGQLESSDEAEEASGDAILGDSSPVTLSELADRIERRHHDYLRAALPRLEQLTKKVAAVHGDRDPRLVRVQEVFADFKKEMESHMLDEERVVFPMIRTLEAVGTGAIGPPRPVAALIDQLEAEHEHCGSALLELRELTDGFVPREDACNTHRAMLDALAELERDTHKHVHSENHLLFPRAIDLEQAAAARAGRGPVGSSPPAPSAQPAHPGPE